MKMRNLELSLGFSSGVVVVGGGVEVDDIVAAIAVAVEVVVEIEVEVEGLGCPGLARAGRRFFDAILKRSLYFGSNRR